MKNIKVRPSRLGIAYKCPASISFGEHEKGLLEQENDTKFTQRGNRIHQRVEELKGKGVAESAPLKSDEEKEAQEYLVFIKELEDKLEGRKEIFIEQSIKLFYDDFYGTADYIALTENELHIVDLKTGFMRIKANDNLQLMAYAISFLELYPKVQKIKLSIYMSQYNESNTAEYTRKELDDFKRLIKSIIKDVNSTTLKFNAGSHCAICDARNVCQYNYKAQGSELAMEYEELDADKINMAIADIDAVSKIAHNATALTKLIAMAKERIKAMAISEPQQAKELGFKLTKRTRKRIVDEDKLINYLEEHGIPKEQLIKTTFIGLTELRKLAKQVDLDYKKLEEEFLKDGIAFNILTSIKKD